ncbi:arylsulfatase [Sphingomonas sp. BT-65]|uniref:arylsulfatase n=1 Tax=Sphingomonas sp. BT-65 TaxID=2989821 RepID=UPI0022369E59|nr:arylsulfatase [Sphingomonas sp. BT-65]MCW4463853.1 arylsulfatase [Sphingomonas sp. BT-65]
MTARRTLMKTIGLALAGSMLSSISGIADAAAGMRPQSAQGGRAPNVVVILVDDMGFSDFGCYGGEIPTPNIDALASGGLRFTQFYNNARCSPTRAALLTGLNPHQAGMGYLSGKIEPESRGTFGRLHERSVTIAQLLQGAGYMTAFTGKWHLGNKPGTTPETRGFDRSLSAGAGGIYFSDQRFGKAGRGSRFLLRDGKRVELNDPSLGKNWYGTDLWTDWGIRYIDEAREKKKPFFLYLAHVAPHFPLMAPQADIEKFVGKYRAGWDKLRAERFKRQQAMGLIGPNTGLGELSDDGDEWDSLSEADKIRFDRIMAVYAAAITRIDAAVGRLTAHLKATGELDNTLILVMSDNGGNAESGPRGRTGQAPWGGPASDTWTGMNWAGLQNTPFRTFKHFTHEGGIATPLVAHWPAGIAANRRGQLERTPGQVIDIMPTVLELTGASYPKTFGGNAILPMEGTSLAPLLKGQSIARGKPLFWAHEGNRAVRDGRWKAVKRLGYPWQLFDMDADRTERTDLAQAQAPRLAAMAATWDKWAERTFVDEWTDDVRRTDWGAPLRTAATEGPNRPAGRKRRRNR